MTVPLRPLSPTPWSRRTLAARALLLFVTSAAWSPAAGQTLPPITIGGGLQTTFVHTEPEGGDGIDAFRVNDARLYINGSATEDITFMFNTAYTAATSKVDVLDAVAQIKLSSKVNLWMGRFLPPSDRANLYGPFYSHNWNVFIDGVQDGYPFIYQGRQNGAMIWSQLGKVKLSGGVFDGASATGNDTVITAGRIQVDFWDPEDGYYLNGTYYGDKNLLAIGAAGQIQGNDRTAYNVDFLLERKVPGGGAATVEAQWARYDNLGGYPAPTPGGAYTLLDGGYVLGSFLFPQLVGKGRFEVLGKVGKARYQEGLISDDTQTTTEINFNYIIRQFNARIQMFYLDTRFDLAPDSKRFGVGLQIQM